MIYSQFCVLNSFTRFLCHDCIIRGIPLRIDYVSKPFWAYISIQIFIKDCINWWWNILLLSTTMNKEIFQDETILALQGRQLDPITALRQAKDIFKYRGAMPPSNLALFRLISFTGKGRHYHNWTYIRFSFPVPEQLRTHNSWDLPRFIKDFETSGRQFIETEPTVIRLRSRWSPSLLYARFPILFNFLCLLSLFCWFYSLILFYFWNPCRFQIWSGGIVVLCLCISLRFRTDRC